MKRLDIWLAIFALFSLSSCGENKKNGSFLNSDIFYVKVEKVVKRDLKEEIVAFGSIKGKDEVIIYPRVSGKIVKNLVKEGDYVKKDDPIALVRKDEVGAFYEPSPVLSTINGYVGKIYQDEGADVGPLTPIALVVDQSYVKVQCDIPERYLSQLKLKQRLYIKVAAYQDKIFYGTIDKITPVLDKLSKTFQIEAILPNDEEFLKSGMSCEVHIIVNEVKAVPTVPLSAIVYRQDIPYIYLADRKNGVALEKRAVIGFKGSDYLWVKNVKEGDEVITLGVEGLKDGAKINIVE